MESETDAAPGHDRDDGQDSGPRTCQWIDDDPGDPDWPTKCGKATVPGRSYCAAHQRRAYTPAPKRQSRDTSLSPRIAPAWIGFDRAKG
jgi:hypothetical protein